MTETREPILHIRGIITEEALKARTREKYADFFRKYVLIYLGILLLVFLGITLYDWLPDLREGYLTLGEWFLFSCGSLFGSFAFWLLAAMLALYGLVVLVLRPAQAVKQMRELHPDGIEIDYSFFEDELVVKAVSPTADETLRIRYSDVRRKIRETPISIVLSAGVRKNFGLHKTVMTPREAESVLALLRERCPQRRG